MGMVQHRKQALWTHAIDKDRQKEREISLVKTTTDERANFLRSAAIMGILRFDRRPHSWLPSHPLVTISVQGLCHLWEGGGGYEIGRGKEKRDGQPTFRGEK